MGVLCKILLLFAKNCVQSSFNHGAAKERAGSELAALLLLFSECHFPVIVLCFFPTVLWVDLQCMIVAFPAHTTFLFGISEKTQ